MSQDQWHCVGYGIETSPAEISPERMLAFFDNHYAAYRRKNPASLARYGYNVVDVFEEYKGKKEIDDDFANNVRECTCNYSYGEIIASIMEEETGVRFISTGTAYDEREAVVFAPDYVWAYSEKEKSLTKDDIETIFETYGMELYGRLPDVDYIDLTFRG